jgi:hypothetical protein
MRGGGPSTPSTPGSEGPGTPGLTAIEDNEEEVEMQEEATTTEDYSVPKWNFESEADVNDSSSYGASYTRNQRATLTMSERAKFHKLVTTPLEPKFALLPSKNYLKQTFDFLVIVERLRARLNQFAMIDVFQIADAYDIKQKNISNYHTDLLIHYHTMKMDHICQWVEFCKRYGDRVMKESMMLSMQLLLNSCETSLFDKVNGELTILEEKFRGGPTVFYIICQQVVIMTEQAVRMITSKLYNMKITDIPEEDVSQYCILFTAGAKRLQACQVLPHDIRAMIIDGLKECSVQEFTCPLLNRWDTGLMDKITWEGILDEARRIFMNVKASNKWKPQTTKRGSTYNQSSTTSTTVANKAATTSRSAKPVDRTAPKAGESKTRKNADNQEEHWCSKCIDGGRWGNHLDAGHDEWYKKYKAYREKKKADAIKKKNEKKSDNDTSSDTTSSSRIRPANRTNYASHF